MTIDPTCTFVLIPGAGGSAFYWYRLVAELEGRGRASVAVELQSQRDEPLSISVNGQTYSLTDNMSIPTGKTS